MADRYIPTDVKRQLRQEAFFGCAACGSPLLDYHHIIPWAERGHNEPEHMIALCPNHHRSLGKMSRKKCYDLKANPYNKTHGLIRGCLGTNVPIDRFIMGSNTFINTPVIFSYFEQPLLSYRVEDDQFLLSAYLPDGKMWPSLKIVDNEINLNRDEAWDFEFRTNYLKLHRTDGTFFEVDIRGNAALVAGSIRIVDKLFEFGSEKTIMGNVFVSNSTFISCGGGLSYGDEGVKIHWPNYAMLNPKPYFEHLSRRR